MTISILLTCHNRKSKTEKCLRCLKEAFDAYNIIAEEKMDIEIFLTDDGCTDGTVEAARCIFPSEQQLHILKGDGTLFWAGGMRFCWNEALKRHLDWEYYLLLNDDTEVMPNVFPELFRAQRYAMDHFGREGIVSGITCSTSDPCVVTYGGDVFTNRLFAKVRRLAPCGEPQICDITNANILFVPVSVVDKAGIFYKGYTHGRADTDYSIMARRKGFPVLLTANFCGRCDHDHSSEMETARKIISMDLRERKMYFKNPLHSSKDFLIVIRRCFPLRLPFVWIGRMLNVYFPRFYYRIKGI